MKKTIQVGTSNFKELIEENHFFVDKSLLIKEFVQNGAKVILTPRPRRFGKTLNMSMIKHFFDIENKEENKNLFKGLKIENEKEIMKMQGRYPVIFLSFKDQKHFNFNNLEESISILISHLFRDYEYLLDSEKLSELDKKELKRYMAKEASVIEYSGGLNVLMKFMYKHYNEKIIVLIDEYDVPLQEAFIRGYYEEALVLVRNILTAGLKDNVYLEKALVTGILRVAKESIFSGLNNLEVNTILGLNFNDKFGFEEEEVKDLLQYYDLECKMDEVKNWYNGYMFGGKVIYNPWSVLNYIKNNEQGFMPYWINSSGNELIKRLLSRGTKETKECLEELIKGNAITKIVDDHIVMKDVDEDEENIWSFLTMSGYLKPIKQELIRGKIKCDLKIPNEEVHIFYENLIEKWFKESLTSQNYNTMLKALITKDIETFDEIFTEFIMRNMSYFDVSGKEPEKVYHAFVLGMIVSLNNEYEVKSNKESGYGRYDVMLIPRDASNLGIIIEFKRIKETNSKTIKTGIEEALKQIEENKYEAELIDRGVGDILKLAIVFKGKKVKIVEG
ncbi:AAA family ATPase [Clostridium butyricum]|uniref:AAA family ATPase n=1 Tax=Clostridium butyricum TaxID=1492 RepID=UPI000F547305|nr:AAA family ATPase [Clostridium butyricum]RQN01310.1 AAA family ATPase [Clostridium butyricum]